ncbi:hypothetical protein B0H13DRAFT_2393912 [Mycena leptocephala]|nr:hypothetical protein B0H13DRAFT_2393912 [Mycena leptocephala]
MATMLAPSAERSPAAQPSTPIGPTEVPVRREMQEGMDRGFALSPMADLVLAFNHHSDEDYSLFRRVNTLSSKKALDISEIIDRGVSIVPMPMARFGLETGFLLRTDRTIKEMQLLLTQAAGLIRGRTSCFTIDPHAVISRVLRSANDLNELHSAWVAMSERLDLAQRNFLKYQAEYRAESDDELLLSPISTVPDVYAVFPREKSSLASDLNYIYDHVPHMKKLWPRGYKVEIDFLPEVMKAPSYLEGAFPDRPSEFRPSTVYYSAEGECKEIIVSTRSSHGAGAQFELPPEDRKSKGKSKEVLEGSTPLEESQVDPAREEIPRKEPSASHWNLSSASQGILGSEIPYKDPSHFFVPKSPRRLARSTTVPGPDLPNPIFGMATSESYAESTSWMRNRFTGDSRIRTYHLICLGILFKAPRPTRPDLESSNQTILSLLTADNAPKETIPLVVPTKGAEEKVEVQETVEVIHRTAAMGIMKVMTLSGVTADGIPLDAVSVGGNLHRQIAEALVLALRVPRSEEMGMVMEAVETMAAAAAAVMAAVATE